MPDQFVLEKIKTGEEEPYEVIAVDAEGFVIVSQRHPETGELTVVTVDGDPVETREEVA